MITMNTMECVKDYCWKYIENELKVRKIDFIKSAIYYRGTYRVRDYVFYTEDEGELCKALTAMTGGEFEYWKDGKRVA